MPDILGMLTHERDKLNRAIEALSVEIGSTLGRIARQGKRTMSAASRARMAAGQRARWAKLKLETEVVKPVKKFTMSPAARAKIGAAMKARWAKAKREAAQMEASAMPKKRTMSPAARAKIAKAQRARWAKMRVGK